MIRYSQEIVVLSFGFRVLPMSNILHTITSANNVKKSFSTIFNTKWTLADSIDSRKPVAFHPINVPSIWPPRTPDLTLLKFFKIYYYKGENWKLRLLLCYVRHFKMLFVFLNSFSRHSIQFALNLSFLVFILKIRSLCGLRHYKNLICLKYGHSGGK